MRRLPVILATLLFALPLAGCGNKQETVTLGETEGIYLDIDDLKYQVQISRYLNPNDVEDQSYLKGLTGGSTDTGEDETWFGVFIRVQNPTEETIAPANDFVIEDTQKNIYRPVPIDTEVNPFAYAAEPIPPKGLIPEPGSAASETTIQGSLLLFKVKVESLQNRPLEFRFKRGSGTTGVVDLDV
jgi:hypothetical protein